MFTQASSSAFPWTLDRKNNCPSLEGQIPRVSNDKELSKKVAIGGLVGLAIGGIGWGAVGGVLGVAGSLIARVVWEKCVSPQNYPYQIDLSSGSVTSEPTPSSEKAKKVIQAFMEGMGVKEEITCPISSTVMIFPMNVQCTDNAPHTFELANIVNHLNKTGNEGKAPCPLCKREIQMNDLKKDSEKEERIQLLAKKIFARIETILKKFPDPDKLVNVSKLSKEQQQKVGDFLSKQVHTGQAFINSDEKELLQKVRNPESLTSAEAYALSEYLLQQFSPLEKKVEMIFSGLDSPLTILLKSERIENSLYCDYKQKLVEWYKTFSIIPPERSTVRGLYELKTNPSKVFRTPV